MPHKSIQWSYWLVGALLLLTSLTIKEYAMFCASKPELPDENVLRIVAVADPQITCRTGLVGVADNHFNDYYYSFVVRNLVKYLKPDVFVVLGDLFSYQSLPDDQFVLRVKRYQSIFDVGSALFINVSGNHDIGYGTELDRWRGRRFESFFGKLNSLHFSHDHALAVINSNNLDRSRDQILHEESWSALRALETVREPIILFTHIPLHKPYGTCIDSPEVVYDAEGYVHSQNMLSKEASDYIINDIKPVVVLTGHDHEGCHYMHGSIQEWTLRSVMAEYGGYAGVLDAVKISDGKWKYAFSSCIFLHHYFVVGLLVSVCIWLSVGLLWAFMVWLKRSRIKRE